MRIISTTSELEAKLGENLRELRLQKNIGRQTLCEQAGISINALRHLESGQGTTVKTLISVVRALGRQDWLIGIAPKISINPLHMVRDSAPRQRARKRSRANGKKEIS